MKNMENQDNSPLKHDYIVKRIYLNEASSEFFNRTEASDSITQVYLKYLFAYMPLSDFADYDFEFFQRQVEYALLAKETFPWSKDIPEDIFRHYVLPPRINNENLDTA